MKNYKSREKIDRWEWDCNIARNRKRTEILLIFSGGD